jgi:nucleoside-diphosphate-sugar epimerase
MRIVVVGATGNVGTSLLQRLVTDDEVTSVLGLARRRPRLELPKVEWAEADVTSSDLAAHFKRADAVVHLAWAIQPSRNLDLLWRINVEGSSRVFRAVAEAGVHSLVYASSVGAYSPGPKDRKVDESWPTDGVPTSFYSRHKAEVERRLDRFELERGAVRVVRLRPALIFKRESATEQRRLFAGPLFPGSLARRGLIPIVPAIPGLRFQAVHSYDVGEAYRLAAKSDARGPFNIAAEPVLDPQELGRILRARPVPLGRGVARAAAGVAFRLRLQPSPSGWLDLALAAPLLDSTRAERELGWRPERSAVEAIEDLLAGMREGAGLDTPPLSPRTSRPLRRRELATRVGGEGGE